MSVLENFKNIPRSLYRGTTGLKFNFFSSNLQRNPWRKKKRGPVAHPKGDRVLSPVGGATGTSMSFAPAIFRHSLYHLSIKIQEKTEG